MFLYIFDVVFVFLLLWTLLVLKMRRYSFERTAKEEAGVYEPHLARYLDFGKLLVLTGTASLAFFINFLVNVNTVGPRNVYSVALEHHIAAPIWFLCASVGLTLAFMLGQTVVFEGSSRGAKYTVLTYTFLLTTGYSAVLWFIVAYGYLVLKLVPLALKTRGT
jgi:hypothetical protein